MFLFVYVNRMVGWSIERISLDQVVATSLSNGVQVQFSRVADDTWPAAFQAMKDASDAGAGAFQYVLVLPRIIA